MPDTQYSGWKKEYTELTGIPLVYDNTVVPAPVRPFFQTVSEFGGRTAFDPVLEVGCGKGRVGMHLLSHGFRMIAFDCVENAVSDFRKAVRKNRLEKKARLFTADMFERWDVAAVAAGAVFAVTVLENVITETEEAFFTREVDRVLMPGGLFVVQCYREEDGYYGPRVRKSPQRDQGVLVDENNGISFKIRQPSQIAKLFAPGFRIVSRKTLNFTDTKYGRLYSRSSELMIFRKQ